MQRGSALLHKQQCGLRCPVVPAPCCTTRLARVVVSRVADSKNADKLELATSSGQSSSSPGDSQIAELAKKVLETDPEAAAALQRYQAAVVRLEKAKAASEELDKIFAQAQKDMKLSDKATEGLKRQEAEEVMATAEVAAAAKRAQAAEVELAQVQRQQEEFTRLLVEDAEKSESGKAASVAAVGGIAAYLPLLLSEGDFTTSSGLSLVAVVVSSLLFGVTYRYAVRSDASSHLRAGAVGAFGLVRAAGAADVLQSNAGPAGPFSLEVIGPAALYAGQSMLLFAISAAALEVAFSQGIVKRFGEAGAKVAAELQQQVAGRKKKAT